INLIHDSFTGGSIYALQSQIPSGGTLLSARGIAVVPWIDVDRSQPGSSPYSNPGRIYISFTDAPGNNGTNQLTHDDTDVFEVFSTNGVTWSPRHQMNDDATTNSQFYATIQVDPDTGLVGATWNDARVSGNNLVV